MKYLLILASLLIFQLTSTAQIIFEKGYFIDNNNKKINCWIKNVEWRNNPSVFQYKLSENAAIQVGSLENVKEFGVTEMIIYRRFNVAIDRSSDVINKLSQKREAEFKPEVLFLKILVEGEATLYHYEEGSLNRFFFTVGGSTISQLVHKRYSISATQAGVNNRFRQQLSNNLTCNKSMIVDKLEYNLIHLAKFFVKYNECKNSEFTTYYKRGKKGSFHLGLRIGYSLNTLNIDGPTFSLTDFKIRHQSGYRFGFSSEITLPFNKNKWSILIEPNLQLFSTEDNIESINVLDRKVTAEVNSIELPIGIRHYFFLNNNSKVFINYLGAMDFHLSTKLDIERTTSLSNSTALFYSCAGLGFGHKNLNFEFRYSASKDILNDYTSWGGKYSGFSFILGFNIF